MWRLIPVVLLCGVFTVHVSVEGPHSGGPIAIAGLRAAAQIIRDAKGIAHLQAASRHDLFFLQGYVHAQDRLFQMDVTRRQASGTLAELLGPAALANDVQLRTLGLAAGRRAVARACRRRGRARRSRPTPTASTRTSARNPPAARVRARSR